VALDLFLEKPAVGQREDVQHEGSGELAARWSGRLPWMRDVQDGVSRCGDEIIASAASPAGWQRVLFATAID
jgi:hypothetical protein